MKFAFIFALLTSFRSSSSVQTENNKYEMVASTFLEQFTTNALTTVPTQAMRKKKSGCLSFCSATPNCHLACYSDDLCMLSSALVSSYWIPVASTYEVLLPFQGYICFSSWNFENDLTTKIANTSVSSTINNYWLKSYAVDGYYTYSPYTHYYSLSEPRAWYQIDMGSPYSISKVIVYVRNGGQYFSNVEVRVGNSPVRGNFTENALLGYLNGSATPGQTDVVFSQKEPIVGRYISLQQLLTNYFMIGEIKVIGY